MNFTSRKNALVQYGQECIAISASHYFEIASGRSKLGRDNSKHPVIFSGSSSSVKLKIDVQMSIIYIYKSFFCVCKGEGGGVVRVNTNKMVMLFSSAGYMTI